MRLPTINQFKNQIQAMSSQIEKVQQLQTQVATGKKLQRASEDPLLAEKINAVNDFVQNVKGYQLNATLAENRVTLVSSNIQEGVNILGRVRELIQSAQNDTLNNSDRANIAAELKGQLDVLMQVANAKDSNGEYIFSGINVKSPAFEKQGSGYIYQGAEEVTQIAIGIQNKVAYNDSGFQVFGNIKTGNGQYVLSSDAVNNTGTGVVTSAGALQNSAYVPDTYTITFVKNGTGKLAYQINGLSSGQVIPVPPLSTPSDAPEFFSGNEISFNGVNLQFSGLPNEGDVFHVNESTTQNMFDSLQQVINTLNTPTNSETEKASFHQVMNSLSASLMQISNHVNGFLTEIGMRGKNIDDQINFSTNVLTDQKILLSKLSDTDMTEVISDLTQRLTTLEVTQQSYLKIQDTLNKLLQI
jgi:flagellar hook-associated protein 3 FlgL